MKDEDLEALLRNVRPAGPSPELRARILAARSARPAWPWAAAAAALLMTIVGLQWSAGELRQEMRPAPAAASEELDTAVLRETFQLSEGEIRAMTMKRDFDRIMAADATQAEPR